MLMVIGVVMKMERSKHDFAGETMHVGHGPVDLMKNQKTRGRTMKMLAMMFVAAAACAYGAEPFMMMRFRGPQTDGGPIWEKTAENLIRHRAACDEVWFSTGIGLPPMSWHVEQSRRQGVAAEALRKAGILPGLQFQATLGHGDSISALEDCSAKDWGGFTGPSGVECRLCSCPRQPGFLAYVAEAARIYAAWRPSTVWVDDDLRIDNHEPASRWSQKDIGGCFCKTCVAAFSAREAAPFDRVSLVAALGTETLKAFFLGGLLFAVLLTPITYFTVLQLVRGYRRQLEKIKARRTK